MFLNLCLALFLLWCKCIQINAQCTFKGCNIKDTVSMQENADEILQLLNRMNNHGQNLQRQFEKLLIQTERQGGENKDAILAHTIADQISQLQNRLDNKTQSLQQQFQKLLNQTERQLRRCENEDKIETQDIADRILRLLNRLDDQDLQQKFQKLLNQTDKQGNENKDAVSAHTIANQISQLQNRLDSKIENLELQFQKLLNQTERQVRRYEDENKVATQDIADQILRLQNWLDDQVFNLKLQFQKLLNQTKKQVDENVEVLLAQTVANQTSQLQNLLDNNIQNLSLGFQKLLDPTERGVNVSTQGIGDQILQLQNRLGNHVLTVQLLFQKVLNQTERDVKGETQGIADQIMQLLRNRLDNHDQNLQLQFQKLLNQTEIQVRRSENEYKVTAQGITDQIFQLRNRLDNHDQNLQLQFQKMLNQTENQGNKDKDAVLAQTISNQTSQLQNRLDDQSQKLQLQFKNLINQTERQVRRCEIEDKVATQGIADQILQLQNQTVQLLCRDLETQIERQDICGPIPSLRDCSDIRASGQRTSGVYPVYAEHQQKLYNANAYCDMTFTNGTSWLVFQRRKNGSVDFYRNWSEYETGFGNANDEFWLGNEMLNLLTSKRNYKLRVELEDFQGNWRYAEYESFSIGPSNDSYTLNISGYSGDAGDSFRFSNGMQFTTKDADNDDAPYNCAEWHHGAWWYGYCSDSNLNGKYRRGSYSDTPNGVFWAHWHGYYYSLKTTEMKIAPATGFT